jgi:hypothetical protein
MALAAHLMDECGGRAVDESTRAGGETGPGNPLPDLADGGT